MLSLNSHSNSKERQIVLQVDMDSFFALVEVREKPELNRLPVVVGTDPKRGKCRSVVCTKAREYGIHSAMPVSQAYKLCPDAVFLSVHRALIKNASFSK